MIGKDKTLKEARLVDVEFNKLKEVILQMCFELDKEETFEKKEIIRIAISRSIKDLEELKDRHQKLINEL